MRQIKVAAAALNQTPLDWNHNETNIRAAIAEARAQDVSVLCLPELCISGYGCEDAFSSVAVQELALANLNSMVKETQGMAVSFGLPFSFEGALFNCSALAANGKLLGLAAKHYLAREGVYYEPRWFLPWPIGVHDTVTLAGEKVPIGDLVFDIGGIRIGFEICEDAWVTDRFSSVLSEHDVDIILNPSASHFAFGKHEIRRQIVVEGSSSSGTAYVYANHVGNEAGRIIWDGGAIIASCGNVLTEGGRLSFRERVITPALIDIDELRTYRKQPGDSRSAGSESLRIVSGNFSLPQAPVEKSEAPTASDISSWWTSDELKQEEFSRAVALGLFDYLRKSRLSGFVISMSGGADSAAAACLVALSIRFALAELGRDEFLKKLSFKRSLASLKSVEEMTGALLTCVYQGTENSGPITRAAARLVAAAIGAKFIELEVGPIVRSYCELVAQCGLEEAKSLLKGDGAYNWAGHDMDLQNIQARVRGPSVWLIANVQNALLLATSNRSEAAVGYTTMDGDTCGGLSPLGGIDKAYLLHWLKWLENTGPAGQSPIPSLHAITVQEPTAELRPGKQTDEADLLPYAVLDVIERLAIRDKLSPLEVFQQLRSVYKNYSEAQLYEWLVKFFTLWSRNQWKRERYAPSFHLDDENLDPKTWCRFPILSGGYERELAELRSFVTSHDKT